MFELIKVRAAPRPSRGGAGVRDVTSGPGLNMPFECSPRTTAGVDRAWRNNLLRGRGEHGQPAFREGPSGTSRRDRIAVSARTDRHSRGSLTLQPARRWHREHEWMTCAAAGGPPSAAAYDLNSPDPVHPPPRAAKHPRPRPPSQESRTSAEPGERKEAPHGPIHRKKSSCNQDRKRPTEQAGIKAASYAYFHGHQQERGQLLD